MHQTVALQLGYKDQTQNTILQLHLFLSAFEDTLFPWELEPPAPHSCSDTNRTGTSDFNLCTIDLWWHPDGDATPENPRALDCHGSTNTTLCDFLADMVTKAWPCPTNSIKHGHTGSGGKGRNGGNVSAVTHNRG